MGRRTPSAWRCVVSGRAGDPSGVDAAAGQTALVTDPFWDAGQDQTALRNSRRIGTNSHSAVTRTTRYAVSKNGRIRTLRTWVFSRWLSRRGRSRGPSRPQRPGPHAAQDWGVSMIRSEDIPAIAATVDVHTVRSATFEGIAPVGTGLPLPPGRSPVVEFGALAPSVKTRGRKKRRNSAKYASG